MAKIILTFKVDKGNPLEIGKLISEHLDFLILEDKIIDLIGVEYVDTDEKPLSGNNHPLIKVKPLTNSGYKPLTNSGYKQMTDKSEGFINEVELNESKKFKRK